MTGKADFETFAHEAEYRSGSDGHLGLLSPQFKGGGGACSCPGDKCPISNRISAGFSHNHCRRYSPIRSLTEAPRCKRCTRITRLHQAHHPWVSSPQTFYIPLSAVPRIDAGEMDRAKSAELRSGTLATVRGNPGSTYFPGVLATTTSSARIASVIHSRANWTHVLIFASRYCLEA